jgi:uncharacterized protein
MDLLAGCSDHTLSNTLQWMHEPATWRCSASGLYIEPDGRTDVFRKYGCPPKDSACFLWTEASGDFSLTAHLAVESIAFGDAGAIAIRRDERMWAKLCIERSPAGELSIVSVVTNEWSDDANNELLPSPEAWLRITRVGNLVGMHYRRAGAWRFVRAFGLEWPPLLRVGVQAQAPLQEGCKVVCSELELSRTVVGDFRSGE